jgi:hypothetical protein
MKTIRIISLSCLAWFCGLLAILITSFFRYETPGLQDVLGFGGLLFLACLIWVPVFYLPVVFFIINVYPHAHPLTFAVALFTVANLPLHIILWSQRSVSMGNCEGLLFFIGFAFIAFVFGIGFAFIHRSKPVLK